MKAGPDRISAEDIKADIKISQQSCCSNYVTTSGK